MLPYPHAISYSQSLTRSTKRIKTSAKANAAKPDSVRQVAANSTNPSKENKLKTVPGTIFTKLPDEDLIPKVVVAKKAVLTDRTSKLSVKSSRKSSGTPKNASKYLLQIPVADLRDASTSVSPKPGTSMEPNTISTTTASRMADATRTVGTSVYLSSNDAMLNDLSDVAEPSLTHPFSYGKKYGNSSKLFVSGRRKTLKLRPKPSLPVSTILVAGAAVSNSSRTKPLKRGSPSGSKDSLRLKKKNKVLKVDDNGGVGVAVSGKRTKARLL